MRCSPPSSPGTSADPIAPGTVSAPERERDTALVLALDTSVPVVRARTAAPSQIDAVLAVVVLANDRVDVPALGDNPYGLSDGALVWLLPDDSTEEGGES